MHTVALNVTRSIQPICFMDQRDLSGNDILHGSL
jgi:hypothetical protein